MKTLTPGLLPYFESVEKYQEFFSQKDICLSAAREILSQHSLSGDLTRPKQASQLVYFCGEDTVIKVFSPPFRRDWNNELLYLRHLQGKTSFPIPEVLSTGMIDRWPYLVMSRLPGLGLDEARKNMDIKDLGRICFYLGEGLAKIHQTPTGPILFPWESWPRFLEIQRDKILEHHKRTELSSEWLDQIPGYLDLVDLKITAEAPLSLLHTELMGAHVLVEQKGEEWELTGLIDFESSSPGHPEYEFASVGIFITQGDKGLMNAFQQGYGHKTEDPGEWSRRVMAYLLLHRYSNLNWFLHLLPEGHGMTRLEELAEFWFGI